VPRARSAGQPAKWDRLLRWSAAAFGVAVALHTADHLRRGMEILPPAVMIAGTAQAIVAAATLVLVFAGSRWAPHAAIAIGFISAVGFTTAHLLPTWGFLSDSFIGAPPAARVTTFSWVTAVVEISADIFFGIVGIAVLRNRNTRTTRPTAAARAGQSS
jgi:hypothetical protein